MHAHTGGQNLRTDRIYTGEIYFTLFYFAWTEVMRDSEELSWRSLKWRNQLFDDWESLSMLFQKTSLRWFLAISSEDFWQYVQKGTILTTLDMKLLLEAGRWMLPRNYSVVPSLWASFETAQTVYIKEFPFSPCFTIFIILSHVYISGRSFFIREIRYIAVVHLVSCCLSGTLISRT